MPSSPALAERVLLIGMMGAGKSTVGRAVAERLGWPYLDSDEQVQAHTGMTVPEIFASLGEVAFRREEALALAQAVTSPGPVVVGVAGGAVLDPENRRQLRLAGLVIWLRAGVSTLAARVGAGETRPLLGDDPAAALARLYQERMPLYRDLADVVIDVDTSTADQVVTEVVAAVAQKWGAGRSTGMPAGTEP
jgi:shikimate kinase